MNKQQTIIFTAICGLTGTIALSLYFSAPFHWMPLPQPNATSAQIMQFGTQYHNAILLDTWLQQLGTILSVMFALALVRIAGRSSMLAGRLTLLTATVVTSLSLAEGTFALGAVLSGDAGHPDSAVTCFELTNVFIHIFLLAPSLFLMLGFALKGSLVLPKIFITTAITLGVLFQTLGVLALFFNSFLFLVIIVLMLQNVWTIAASVVLLVRRKIIEQKMPSFQTNTFAA